MQAANSRHIRSGAEYDQLFPKASVSTHTVMRNAGVDDTVALIPKKVRETLYQTKKIAALLKGSNDYDTCRNIWQFVYRHIAYRKDKDGYEQIRSPSRSWHDRKSGVDCDCYATFISSILTNLRIPHLLRITKYNHDYYQHIYPVARTKKGDTILDCVTDTFDYEVPYSQKKDYPMDLQYLDGIDGLDGEDYSGGHDLGRHKKKTHHHKKSHESFEDFMNHPDQIPAYGIRKKKGFKRVLSFVNKFNPATLTVRNGVLASMKLNIGAAAKRLRWAYLTPNQAKAKGMDMEKWKKLVQVRQHLDNLFYGAGGKPENLKKSILRGKGNKDKAIHGLGAINHDPEIHYMNEHTPIRKLLGDDIFYSENEGAHDTAGLGALGEPFTLASITSASGIIAVIVKMIKKVGDVFGGKGSNASDFDPKENEEAEKNIPGADKSSDDDSPSANDNSGSASDDNSNDDNQNSDDMTTSKNKNTGKSMMKTGSGDSTDINVDDKSGSGSGSGGDDESFWQKNKKWLLPASIGAGGLAVIAIGMHLTKKPKSGKAVNGLPAPRKNHRRKQKAPAKKKAAAKGKSKGKGKAKKKKSVALM